MGTKKWVLIFVLGLLCSCHNNRISRNVEHKVISLQNLQLENTPALRDFDYIKLETHRDGLIGDINRAILHESKIFILTDVDNPRVLVFDISGDFLYKISYGRGPNEVYYPIDIAVNENELLILERGEIVKKFSLAGEYINTISLEKPAFYFEAMEKGLLLYDPNMVKTSDYLVTYLTDKGKMENLLRKGNKGGLYRDRGLTKLSPDSILVSSIFSDSIYLFTTQKQELESCFVFDYNGKSSNKKANNNLNYADYIKYTEENNLFTGPIDVSYSGIRLLFGIRNRSYIYGMFDSDTEVLTMHSKLFQDLPNYYGKSGQVGDRVIYAYDILWLMNYFEENPPQTDKGKELRSICNNLDDNPIIVLGYL